MPSESLADLQLTKLKAEIERQQAPNLRLMAKFVERAGARTARLRHTAKAARIAQLIELGAGTEAALAMLELEAPQWALHRLVNEADTWLCSLRRPRNIPDWLADRVEYRHVALPLAILGALLEAIQFVAPSSDRLESSVPQCRRPSGNSIEPPIGILCCDNF